MSKLLSALESEEQLSVLMARQPIFSKSQDVVAFELLFRGSDGVSLATLKDEFATFDVVMNTYANIVKAGGNQKVPCYLKVTDKVLLADLLPDLPPSLFSLEILGRSDVSPAFVEKLQELSKKGYRIVLADYDPENPKFTVLLNVIHVLKLDIQKLGLSELPGIIQKLKPYQLDLLADKVETKDEFRQCLEMGFTLYQGYFLSRPVAVKGKKINSNKILLLQLLGELEQENATGVTLEEIAINDPALTYKILKVVNSAAFHVPREINSLSHAITLLGMEQIRRWIMLFLSTSQDGKPNELTRNMLIRGRMCELLAELMGHPNTMNYFIVGLLSQLDAMFDIEMKELLKEVPLSSELKNALLYYSGAMGETLKDVEFYERGQFDQLQGSLEKPLYEVAYRHSLKWSDNVMQALLSSD
ncbi:EAL and HDOD domain-containing protein [Neptunomonas antarctica]|uniref:EAL and modified HD-GYP domain-containing signal transduction protein n=1 Tax=Neptunomonas antarctica TaxID=619304 RepID=A0A1N7J0H4_9GAMM|nr:HDOD domain-containing protein [Neptunomonas antarctica]SIS42757.1 EAL and modified HD-GYP domain-containing signal transduction protein [Neptunomonas antarctica]